MLQFPSSYKLSLNLTSYTYTKVALYSHFLVIDGAIPAQQKFRHMRWLLQLPYVAAWLSRLKDTGRKCGSCFRYIVISVN